MWTARRSRPSRKLGMMPVEVTLPDWPYGSLNLILFAEGGGGVRGTDARAAGWIELKMQVPDAWPNLFRQARFLSAVDFVQADRLRRKVAQEMARIFSRGGSAAGAFAARRDADDQQLHRPSVADVARGLRRGGGSAQRLGARSGASAAQILAAAARAAWRDADRPAVR